MPLQVSLTSSTCYIYRAARIDFFAIRPLRIGEELVIDYGVSCWRTLTRTRTRTLALVLALALALSPSLETLTRNPR